MSRGAKGASLADPVVLAERLAALDGGHMVSLNGYVSGLRQRYGPVPFLDPCDGGAEARLLLLLETPGPSTAPVRFVSRDNPTGTAANLRRFLAEAGWARRDTAIWNAVPWVIHATGARNRPPKAQEIAAGIWELPAFFALLPRLAAVVLAGRVAARALPTIAPCIGQVPVLTMPHPSPTFVCTDPAIQVRIRRTLCEARALLD